MQNDAPTEMLLPIAATLRDGRQVLLRGLQVRDKPALQAAFQRLSADARYTRFMTSMRELPDAMIEAALHPVPGREFTVVAVNGEGGHECIVGSARYVSAPGSDTCEFAVTVADDWHAVGLARRLVEKLIEIASTEGFRCMEGYVLAANTSMRRLAKRLGFSDAQCPDDVTLRIVRLALAANGL